MKMTVERVRVRMTMMIVKVTIYSDSEDDLGESDSEDG